MQHFATKATAALVVMTAHVLFAQTPMKPTAPGTAGDPAWQAKLRLSDGRTFVTDGGLAIDAAVANPAKLPEREVPSKVLEGYLNTPRKDEYGFRDFSAAASGKTFTAPNGIPLNATYINFLRRVLSSSTVRFRMGGELDPVSIVADGKIVGVLMPVRK